MRTLFRASLVCGILMLCVAVQATAQIRVFPRVEGAASFGASVPTGTFDDNADVGFTYGASAGYYFTVGSSVGLAFDMFNNGANDTFKDAQGVLPNVDAKFEGWQLALYYKQIVFPRLWSPYILVQAGIFDISAKADGREVNPVDARYSLAGGAGLQLRRPQVRSFGGFVEVMFHRLVVKEANPDEESDLRSLFTVRAGVNLFLGVF